MSRPSPRTIWTHLDLLLVAAAGAGHGLGASQRGAEQPTGASARERNQARRSRAGAFFAAATVVAMPAASVSSPGSVPLA